VRRPAHPLPLPSPFLPSFFPFSPSPPPTQHLESTKHSVKACLCVAVDKLQRRERERERERDAGGIRSAHSDSSSSSIKKEEELLSYKRADQNCP